MHELGIAHRDLKLDNIMVNGSESIRIVDFGLSTMFDPDDTGPQLRDKVGTAHFMAPEILSDKSYNSKVDMWALGVVCYMLFSQGKKPFEGSNEESVHRAIRRANYHLPKEVDANWTEMSSEAKDFVS